MINFGFDMPFFMMAFYGSIMIVLVYLLRVLLKKRLPKFVFPTLWGLVLVRLLVPFSLSTPISMPVPHLEIPSMDTVTSVALSEDGASNIGIKTQVVEYSGGGSFNWLVVLLVLFALGALITAGILFYQRSSYSKKLKNSLLIEHNEIINGIIREMDMGHILVFSNDEIASPLVCGLLRPRIFLPTRMDFNNTQLLRHILSHETVHIKHKDNWIKLVMVLALCLNWYNPLAWLMSKWLSADLETACDNAVLKQCGSEEKQSYASSLLSMAVTGNRSTLLYSAFSKTEVERRIRSILNYKKVTAAALIFSMILMLGSTVVFATGGQAPFSEYLTSYCASPSSNWGIRATVTRGVALGENSQKRAENVIFGILEIDETKAPDIIVDSIKTALAVEFGVEKNAFAVTEYLMLSDEEIAKEYALHGITKSNDKISYEGEKVRYFADKEIGTVLGDSGELDIIIERNRMGNIIEVKVLREGDSEFDRRTKELERNRIYDFGTHTIAEGSEVSVVENGFSFYRF